MEEAERDGRLRMDFPPDLIADGEGEG
jgi:hypothetical protein